MDKDFGEFLRKTYAADISLLGIAPDGDVTEWNSLTVGETLLFGQKRMMAIATLRGDDLQRWLPLRQKEFAEWKMQDYQQPWAGPAVDTLDPTRTYRLLVSIHEASSMEEQAIHPQYLRFLQEGEFESAFGRFVRERGLASAPCRVAPPAAASQTALKE